MPDENYDDAEDVVWGTIGGLRDEPIKFEILVTGGVLCQHDVSMLILSNQMMMMMLIF